jgi:hypothetical protein
VDPVDTFLEIKGVYPAFTVLAFSPFRTPENLGYSSPLFLLLSLSAANYPSLTILH